MSDVAATPSAQAEQAPASDQSIQVVQADAPQSSGKKKIKLDGKDVEVDSRAMEQLAKDLGISEDVFLKDYGTSSNATRKSQEAAVLRREAESMKAEVQSLIDNLKSNPKELWKLAQQLGHNPEALAEDLVWNKIQYEKMSPEAKSAMTEKQRADAAEKRLKDIEAENNEKLTQVQAQDAEQEIESDVMKVLEMAKRKADPGLIRRVAEIYESHILAKKSKPSHEYVVQKLREIRRQEFSEDLEGTDMEELMNTLPKGFITKLQAHLVSKARTGNLPSITPSGSAPSTQKAKQPRVSIDEFFKNL